MNQVNWNSGSHAEQDTNIMLGFEAGFQENSSATVPLVGDVNLPFSGAVIVNALHIPAARGLGQPPQQYSCDAAEGMVEYPEAFCGC